MCFVLHYVTLNIGPQAAFFFFFLSFNSVIHKALKKSQKKNKKMVKNVQRTFTEKNNGKSAQLKAKKKNCAVGLNINMLTNVQYSSTILLNQEWLPCTEA